MSRGFDGFEIDDSRGWDSDSGRDEPEFVFFFKDSDRTPKHP